MLYKSTLNDKNVVAYNDNGLLVEVEGENGALNVNANITSIPETDVNITNAFLNAKIIESVEIDTNITNSVLDVLVTNPSGYILNNVNTTVTNQPSGYILNNVNTTVTNQPSGYILNNVNTTITNNPSGYVLNEILNSKIDFDYLDSAFRLRVSQQIPVGEYRTLKDKNIMLFDEAGTGTGTFISSGACVEMSVNAGQYLIRQTKRWNQYNNGKSQLIEITFTDFGLEANITKRIGYFSSSSVAPFTASYDGFYVENDGTNYYCKIDRDGTNLYNIPRNQWDDPLDGTGRSGLTMNFDKFSIFIFDFLWLGGKGVRFGAVINSKLIWFHKINYSNNGDGVMFLTPNKPIRYEIRSNGGSGKLRQICSAVNSEGALTEIGSQRSFDTGTAHISVSSIGTFYAVCGIRLQSTARDIPAKIEEISTFSITADNYLLRVLLNPTIAGIYTYNNVTNSYAQACKFANTNTVTGGTLLYSRHCNQQFAISSDVLNLSDLGSSIAGVMDEIVIAVSPLTSNMDIFGAMHWHEYS